MSLSAFISVIALVCWLVIGVLIWTCTSVLFRRFEDANKRLLRVLRLRSLARPDAPSKVVNDSESDFVRAGHNSSSNNNNNDNNNNDDDDDADADEDGDDFNGGGGVEEDQDHDSHLQSSAIVTSVEDRIILRSLKRNYRRKQRATLRAAFELTFSRLGLRLRSGQEVLRDVSGHFRSRRLTAVMGPSGSGKTTLLNVLSGRASYGTTTGDVFINGIKDEIARYNKVVGFVPQDDNTLLGELTVLEILETSAATRLPAHYSEFQRLQLVEETLELLGLSEVRFAPAGTETRRSLSGGQRRRLSVGVELVAQPLLLCLDEPTSGLDSSSAKSLVSALRKLSRSGLTIAAVIHQPRYEIFEMFDDVLILGKGGQTVFQGAVTRCMEYFASLGYDMPVHANPADFLMDVVSGEVRPTSEARARLALATARRRMNGGAVAATAPPPIDESAALLPSSDLLAPAMLFECWRARLLDEPDAVQSAVPAPAPALLSAAAARPLGTQLEFWGWLIAAFLFPYALGLIYMGETSKQRADVVAESEDLAAAPVSQQRSLVYSFIGRSYSMRARYGALTGVVGLMMGGGVVLVAASAVFGPSNTWGDIAGGIVLILTAIVSAATIAIQWTGAISRGSRRRATFLGNMLLGVMFGPFVLLTNLFNMSHKARAAMTSGGMIGSVVLVLIFMFGQFAKRTELATLIAVTLFVAFLTALFAALMRYNHLPHSERRVSGALTQTYVFTMRGLTQMVRNWPGIALDIGLNLTSGLFLGLVFYQRAYQGPIFSPFGVDVGKTFECPPFLQDYFQPACALLIVPIDDPLPGEASLSCLAVAMAAVASSMRVFGAEMPSFRREAGVGLNTGAYYIGKSLSHLPIVFAAPFAFLMSYGGLAALAGSWTEHYLLLVCVYSISASIAYIVSMLVRRELSQLCGVILLLVFMMFSGANPTLLQLRENSLLGNLLYYPSFLSFLRFSQELFYLIEARAHHIGELTMDTLYGFSSKDEEMCWAFLLMFVVCFRVIGFLALVFEENAGKQLASLARALSPLKKTQ
jgi:ABC-type multidrug transport system ATPase subunit